MFSRQYFSRRPTRDTDKNSASLLLTQTNSKPFLVVSSQKKRKTTTLPPPVASREHPQSCNVAVVCGVALMHCISTEIDVL